MRLLFVGDREEYYRSLAGREDGEPFSLSFISYDAFTGGLADVEPFDALVVPAMRFLSTPPGRLSGAAPAVTIACGPASIADECFEAGCTDYLCEPWGETELRARVKSWAQSRRRAPDGVVSLEGRRLVGPSGSVILSEGDGRLLALLLASRGEPVSRSTLAAVAGVGTMTGRALDMHVSRLRSALRSVGAVDSARGLKAGNGAYSMS